MARYKYRPDLKCDECGKEMPQWTPRVQKFCSNACKQRAYRKRMKIKRAEEKTLKALNEVEAKKTREMQEA